MVTILVFENRVLRKIFGPKRDEVTGGSIKGGTDENHIRFVPSKVFSKFHLSACHPVA
jgi:hypothetical protein